MHLAEWIALVVLVSFAPLAIGAAAYVGGSFLVMRPHVQARPAARALLEAMREAFWVAATQPLLPLFYFAGRRLARGEATPVVVVHGYAQNRVDFLHIARAIARAKLGPVYGFNYPWFATIDGNVARLARFVDRVLRETGRDRVHLVAHSLGGLVAAEYAHAAGPERAASLVTIASPHAGVAWRGPIFGACGPHLRQGCAFVVERAARAMGVPCLSLFSTHDNVVHPPRTSHLAHRGARDVAVPHVGHLSILFHPEVSRAIVEFLAK